MRIVASITLAMSLAVSGAVAQESVQDAPQVVLFKNVSVWDGISEDLQDVDVLVVKNLIRKALIYQETEPQVSRRTALYESGCESCRSTRSVTHPRQK